MDALLPMAAARLVQFVGGVLLFGTPIFFLNGLPESEVRKAWPRWALPLAALLVGAAALGALALQTAAMTGEPGKVADVVAMREVLLDTTFGHGTGARLLLAALAYVAALSSPGRGGWFLTAIAGAGVLASFAWTGHGAADEGALGLIHLGADIIHLLSAAAWLGALAGLAVLVFRQADREVVRTAMVRISGVGPALIAILVLSGLVNAWLLIGPAHIGQALGTDYGRVLAVKLALILAMLALAGGNRWVLTPRLAAGPLRGLKLSVGLETLAGALVLALVAVMGTMAPPMAM